MKMTFIFQTKRITALLLAAALITTACNKEPEGFPENPIVPPTGLTLAETLQGAADDSLYFRLVERAGLTQTLNSRSNTYTMFVPNNNAMKQFVNAASGGQVPLNAPDAVFSAFISNAFPRNNARAIVQYNTVPQAVPSGLLPNTFPNLQYPSILNPAPQLSSLFRLTTFVSSRNGAFVNNIPVTAPDLAAANGIIHGIPAVNIPPSQYLWDRINSDADLTILKAAIQRADSAGPLLVPALQNIGANFTVFAPTNLAFKQVISYLTGGLIPVAAPDAVFIGFIQSNNITTQLALGLVVYHVFDGQAGRPGRAFLNNFPAGAAESYPTLLNSNPLAANHPGVSIKATFTGPIVTAATVKGLINQTAANVLVDPTPSTGSSDQHYLNGTLHKIDQVLLPVTP